MLHRIPRSHARSIGSLGTIRGAPPPLRPKRQATPIIRPLPHRRRTLIAPPAPGSGPLLERRADRELPPIPSAYGVWLKTLPIFVGLITVSALAIFNYQKSSSPVVSAVLYALRTNPRARDFLGDQVHFRDRIPWIWGELNQLHGRIDISFAVKGTKGKGFVKFRSVRRSRLGSFETVEWSLETEDGTILQLLSSTNDPSSQVAKPSQL